MATHRRKMERNQKVTYHSAMVMSWVTVRLTNILLSHHHHHHHHHYHYHAIYCLLGHILLVGRSVRLELIVSMIMFVVALFAVIARSSVSSVAIGIALIYTLQLTALFQVMRNCVYCCKSRRKSTCMYLCLCDSL